MSIKPGATLFIKIPSDATSAEIDAVKPSNANLLAEYGARLALLILPHIELMLTIRPHLFYRILGITAWHSKNGAMTFTFCTNRNSS